MERLMSRLLPLLLSLVLWNAPASSAENLMTEGFINAPLGEVWQLFTSVEGLRRAGAAQAEVELKIGGVIRTHRDPKGKLGDDETTVQRILAFDPQRMLALRFEQTPLSLPGRDAASDTWRVMYFAAAGDGMTHIRIVGLGFHDAAASQALRKHLDVTHRTMLAQLAKPYWPTCALCKAPEPESAAP
jgi:uncharacterized protein YndB with AHSA1/START domain